MTTAIAHRSPEGTLPSRRRLTYEEVIDYIARDPDKIKYPNRQAKILRNSFELSFLDTLNFEQLQEQQLRAQKFQVGQMAIQQAAVDNGTSAVAEAVLQPSSAIVPATRNANPVNPVNVRNRIGLEILRAGLQLPRNMLLGGVAQGKEMFNALFPRALTEEEKIKTWGSIEAYKQWERDFEQERWDYWYASPDPNPPAKEAAKPDPDSWWFAAKNMFIGENNEAPEHSSTASGSGDNPYTPPPVRPGWHDRDVDTRLDHEPQRGKRKSVNNDLVDVNAQSNNIMPKVPLAAAAQFLALRLAGQ